MIEFRKIIAVLSALSILAISEPNFVLANEAGSDPAYTDKSVTALEDGNYRVTLEQFVTGTTYSVDTTVPTDFIFVLDQSTSMREPFESDKNKITDGKTNALWKMLADSGKLFAETDLDLDHKITVEVKTDENGENEYHYFINNYNDGEGTGADAYKQEILVSKGADTVLSLSEHNVYTFDYSKLYRMQETLRNFIGEVKSSSAEGDEAHDVAIFGFASAVTNPYENSEAFDGANQINFNDITSSLNYAPVRKNVVTQYDEIMASIDALDSSGTTAIENGMRMAREYLDYHKDLSGYNTRNKVIIVITDGCPSHGYVPEFDKTIANTALGISFQIDEAYKPKIFTIGMFSGCDPSKALISGEYSTDTDSFLHLLSSNYPRAKAMNDIGNPDTYDHNGGYYCSATSTTGLENTFEHIKKEVDSAAVQIGSEAVVKDVVSQYFDIVEDVEPSAYTVDCTGKSGDAFVFDESTKSPVTLTYENTGRLFTATGFDFGANYCSDKIKSNGTYGKKLVIEFDIKPREGFYGGNSVPTNDIITDEEGNQISPCISGLYLNAKETVPLDTFETQYADVPINVPVSADEINIYAGNSFSVSDLCSGISHTSGDDFWQDDYVDIDNIEYSFSDKNGMESCDVLNDAEYKVNALVKPLHAACGVGEGNSADGTVFSATAKVNVFTPVITFKDSTIYLGTKADYSDNNVGVIWKHKDVESTSVEMKGEVPSLEYSYDPDLSNEPFGYFKEDTPVNITSVSNGNVVLFDDNTVNYVEFIKTADSIPGDDREFTVKVLTCEITITKEGANENYGGDDQTFIITLKGENTNGTKYADEVDIDVAITGNSSVTIKGLPVGKYTVTENGDWSWRYISDNAACQLTAQLTSQEMKVVNTLNEDKWLDGNAVQHNIFKAFTPAE